MSVYRFTPPSGFAIYIPADTEKEAKQIFFDAVQAGGRGEWEAFGSFDAAEADQ